MDQSCGYLYIATGPEYVKEALRSAQSLRGVCPDAHISLVTDEPIETSAFDQILIRHADGEGLAQGLAYKVRHIYDATPYENTLFLDTDTFVCGSPACIFAYLNYADIALAAAPADRTPPCLDQQLLPDGTPYNTGVILFRRSTANKTLFQLWRERYEAAMQDGLRPGQTDQTSFAEALLISPARLHLLSNIWNARTPYYFTITGTAGIIHGRHRDYQRIAQRLNKTAVHRLWTPQRQKCLFMRRPLLQRYAWFRKLRRRLLATPS